MKSAFSLEVAIALVSPGCRVVPEACRIRATTGGLDINSTTDDLGVLYMNTVVLKRTGSTSMCVVEHVDMLPDNLSG